MRRFYSSPCLLAGFVSVVLLTTGSGCGQGKPVDFSEAEKHADITYQCMGTCGDVIQASVKLKGSEKMRLLAERDNFMLLSGVGCLLQRLAGCVGLCR